MLSRPAMHRAGWLVIALLLMGMDGCPQSQVPLSARDEGFVDPSLIGTWQGTGAQDWVQLLLGTGVTVEGSSRYAASFDESGGLKVVQYGDKGQAEVVFSGFTSLLDGRRYLNLKTVECPQCEEALYELDEETCPYLILQYATELPRRLAGSMAERDPEFEGRALFVGMMDEEFVVEAIDKGLIDSDPACLPCIWEGPCMTSEQEELQQFVSKHDTQLYPTINWEAYVEVPGVRPE